MNYENFELIDRVEQECKLWAANNPNWLKDYKARIQMESEKSGNPGRVRGGVAPCAGARILQGADVCA